MSHSEDAVLDIAKKFNFNSKDTKYIRERINKYYADRDYSIYDLIDVCYCLKLDPKAEIKKTTLSDSIFESSVFNEVRKQNIEITSMLRGAESYEQDSGNRCKKCESTNTFIRSVQDRSGDEGMSIYVFCKNCGYSTSL